MNQKKKKRTDEKSRQRNDFFGENETVGVVGVAGGKGGKYPCVRENRSRTVQRGPEGGHHQKKKKTRKEANPAKSKGEDPPWMKPQEEGGRSLVWR